MQKQKDEDQKPQQNNKKLLIFSAHPDDHLSCAGTAMYLKSIGFDISEVVFTNGENSVNKLSSTKKVNKKDLVNLRQTEFLQASKIIGTSNWYFLGYPNDGVSRTNDAVMQVVEIIRKEKPLIIISENPNDYHYDHRAVAQIVTEAVDRAGWGIAKELGEPHRCSLNLYMGSLLENESIDVLVDVTKFWEQKNKILECYGSQMGGFGFQLNDSLGMYAGFKLRTKYAESFQLMKGRAIRLNSLIKDLTMENSYENINSPGL